MSNGAGQSVLTFRGVRKRYGKTVALDGLDLDIPRGSIFGLVGPNGAGKTTTFAVACGFVRPDGGTVDLFGEGPFDPARHRGRVSALPQDAQIGRDMPLEDQLEFLARLQGLGREEARRQVWQAVGLADVASRARARTRTLSHGMIKRVAIAQAFLGNPELVLLDEPTSGLDPRQAEAIRAHIGDQRGKRTVVVSSHNLNEIEAVCDHVAMIEAGRVVVAGPLDRITGKDQEVRISLAPGPNPLAELREVLAGDSVVWLEEHGTLVIRFAADPARQAEDVIAAALRVLLDHGARVSEVVKGQTLERAYLEST